MAARYKHWRNVVGIIVLLFAPLFISSVAKATIQGSTVIGDYYLYAEVTNYSAGSSSCGNALNRTSGCNVNIYRCKRTGGTVLKNTCKKIIKNARLGHANTLDSIWGTNHFYVYNGWCNPKTMGGSICVKGCFDTSGHKVKVSECNKESKSRANNDSNYFKSHAGDCKHNQGYARYKVGKSEYFIKGFSHCRGGGNKISIFKNKNHQKTISGLKPGRELEDVMVDCSGNKNYCVIRYTVNGDTGHLYGVNYKLPKSSDAAVSTQEIKKYKGKHISPASPKKIKSKATTKSNYDGTVDTTFFGKIKGDDKGCSVFMVLNFIIEILTYGIGITAVIGISVFGIMYLTAGGDVGKTTKAKKRIYEIIIGLAIYAVLWALLNFLLPGGNLNSSNQCKTEESTSEN